MSKLMKIQRKIVHGVVSGYEAVENGVVSGSKKIEKAFVSAFLSDDDETPKE
jgi:hypothetical protein